MRAGGHFTALSFSEEIVVMNLLSYFSIKTVMCGQAWLSFLYAKGGSYEKDKRRYLWVEEAPVD